MTVATETEMLAGVSTEALMLELYARTGHVGDVAVLGVSEKLDAAALILRRVEALLDAVDRHPLARRWLGLP